MSNLHGCQNKEVLRTPSSYRGIAVAESSSAVILPGRYGMKNKLLPLRPLLRPRMSPAYGLLQDPGFARSLRRMIASLKSKQPKKRTGRVQ